MMKTILAGLAAVALLAAAPSGAITLGPFGPHGEGGTKNGQVINVGPGGTIFELDGFVNVAGMDLNGSQFGTSAQLSRDTLPAGMGFSFTNYLSANQADLVLSYTFTNTGSTSFTNVSFFVLVDPEIDEDINTFFNEYATTSGSAGVYGYDASQWQIDEPGFENGTLFKNIFLGSLSESNAIPPGTVNDVAMSLGFSLGNLGPGASSTVLVQISEQGDALGSLALSQHDSDPASTTVITASGIIPATAGQMRNPTRTLLVLQGQVVRDGSSNGVANPTTSGLPGVLVSLMSNSIPVMTNTTDSSGQYHFSVPPGIEPGTYAINAAAPGLTFVPVLPAEKAYFATTDPSTNTLPLPVPVLNFDFRGAITLPFGNVSGLVQFGLTWQLDYATGSLLGTLSITNPPSSLAAFGPPWQLGMKSSTNYFFAHPAGKLPDGLADIDVSALFNGRIPGGVINPGGGSVVVLTNAVEIFSLYRIAPSNSLFEVWATQQ